MAGFGRVGLAASGFGGRMGVFGVHRFRRLDDDAFLHRIAGRIGRHNDYVGGRTRHLLSLCHPSPGDPGPVHLSVRTV